MVYRTVSGTAAEGVRPAACPTPPHASKATKLQNAARLPISRNTYEACCSEKRSGGRSALRAQLQAADGAAAPKTPRLLAAQFIFCFGFFFPQSLPGAALYHKFPPHPSPPQPAEESCSRRTSRPAARESRRPPPPARPGRPPFPPRGARTASPRGLRRRPGRPAASCS